MTSYPLPKWICTLHVHENAENLEEVFRSTHLTSLETFLSDDSGKVPAAVARRLWLALLHIAAAAHAEGRVIGDIPVSAIWMEASPEAKVFCLKLIEEFKPPQPPQEPSDWELGPALPPEPESPASDLFNIATQVFRLLVGADKFSNDTEMFRALDRVRLFRADLPEELLLKLFRHLEQDPALRPHEAVEEISLFTDPEKDSPTGAEAAASPMVWSESDAGAHKRRKAAQEYTYANQHGINQDAYVLRKLSDTLHILGVFDGVSTCTLGDGGQAAEIAQEVFEEQSFDSDAYGKLQEESERLEFIRDWLGEAFKEANYRIAVATRDLFLTAKKEGREVDTSHTMLTTATVAVVAGNKYVVAWAGDSPAFTLNKNSSAPLTFSHDKITEMLSRGGSITETFTIERDSASALTKHLGGVHLSEENEEQADEIILEAHKPDFVEGTLTDGSFLMLASDGILDQNSDKSFISLLKSSYQQAAASSHGDQEQQGEELFNGIWSGANHRSQRDNITLILFHRRTGTSRDGRRKGKKQ